jgi:hypothetical protein
MKTIIIAGYVIEPMPAKGKEQFFKILTIDKTFDSFNRYNTIASEFARITGYQVIRVYPGLNNRFKFSCRIPDEPRFKFDPDDKDADIDGLSKWFDIDAEFLQSLHDKLTDPNDIFLACQFFKDGVLAYDIAIGDEPIDIPTIRANYIAAMEKKRASAKKLADFYNSCTTVTCMHPNGTHKEVAFIRDGRLVAFGQFTLNHCGGIYAAHNKVQKIPNWNPHECVAKFRRLNKAIYRQIKKLAYDEPAEIFQFDQRTIRKKT